MHPLFLAPSISEDLSDVLVEFVFGDITRSLSRSYSTAFCNFYFKAVPEMFFEAGPETLHEMFFEALPEALSNTCWSAVITAWLAAIIVILGTGIFSSSPRVYRSRKSNRTSNMEGWRRLTPPTLCIEPEAQTSSSSSPPPARAKKKTKKSVKFDLDRNETVEVGDWYVRTWGTGTSYAGVRWGEQLVWTVDRYLEPHGHTQLHFPQTKWIRDVPSWDVENDDGDIEMTDI